MPKSRRAFFEVKSTFRAPLEFVYEWLTDFSSRDPALLGDDYERRILVRSRRRKVFEDLSSTPDGWVWLRNEVTCQPPDSWHLTGIGNRLCAEADYKLTPAGSEASSLRMRWRLRSGLVRTPIPPREVIEPAMSRVWSAYAELLERDYRSRIRNRAARQSL